MRKISIYCAMTALLLTLSACGQQIASSIPPNESALTESQSVASGDFADYETFGLIYDEEQRILLCQGERVRYFDARTLTERQQHSGGRIQYYSGSTAQASEEAE